MRETRQATIVGLFIIGAILLITGAVLLFSGPSLLAQPIRVVTFFEGSVAGLESGAPVTYRGVKVGSVSRIAILVSPTEREPTIPVYLELFPSQLMAEGGGLGGVSSDDVGPLVEQGLRTQLAAQSIITGQMRVELDFMPDAPRVFVGADPSVPEIPAVKSDLQALREEIRGLDLRGLTSSAQSALTAINDLAAAVQGEVGTLSGSVDGVARSAERAIGEIEETVAALRVDLDDTLASIRSLAETTEEQIAARGSELSSAITAIEGLAAGVNAASGSLSSMLDPRSSLRTDLDATLRDLAVAAGALRSFALQLDRNPSAIITGR